MPGTETLPPVSVDSNPEGDNHFAQPSPDPATLEILRATVPNRHASFRPFERSQGHTREVKTKKGALMHEQHSMAHSALVPAGLAVGTA